MKINFISKAFDRFNRYLTPHVSNAAKSSILRNAESVPQKETNLVKATVEELKTKEAKTCNSFSAEEAIKYTIAPKPVNKPQSNSKIKVMLNKSFNRENIPEYPNSQVIKELKEISGEGLEVAEKSKNIFLKELGFPKDLLKLEENNNLPVLAAFDYSNGVLSYKKEFLNFNKNEIISYIRHELDHLECSAELCKAMGVDDYINMIVKVCPGTPIEQFNKTFWKKATRTAKTISKEELNSRMDAFKNYFSNRSTLIDYLNSPLEQRAYNVQGSVLKSLNEKLGFETKDIVLQSKLASKISDTVTAIKTKYPNYKDSTINDLYFDEVEIYRQGKGYKNGGSGSLMLENMLSKLKKMYPDVI